MSTKNEYIQQLKRFNRKERFYLIGKILGNPDFSISCEFAKELTKAFGRTDINFLDILFSAMDYHLDWLYAAMFIAGNDINDIEDIHKRDDEHLKVSGNQEDMDFILVAGDHEDENICHLILIEAKAETGWNNKQLTSKAKRLETIFGADGNIYEKFVIPHFVVLSPNKVSPKIDTTDFPSFMVSDSKLKWIELPLPELLQKTTRCDNKGKNSHEGNFWKVENTK